LFVVGFVALNFGIQ